MKIAITSPNAKTVSGHAGKCPGYLVFDVEDGQIVSQTHIKLGKEQVFRNFSGSLSATPEHPLNGIQGFISQSMGDGLIKRLLSDGIQVQVTEQNLPENALKEFLTAHQSVS
ncbi:MULTISPECIES: NifB/NifX family molybdenum-iron cluster-binding protein [Thiomicrorhabdus]|uniref:Nitrogen fixation protein n=1 Tax=Thiomicrorhabdus heinhorstiae TaxID=2748010 RepID=A0ABS0BZ91_9GAMM|nr:MULTISPECIES: NifB/NifX family molybdenum-iron cluster-binding protein [Thiomicrorhabdus]MBF6059112.1 nitrogen fixation protein [Thiomicrorhabdus heinhorstiae]